MDKSKAGQLQQDSIGPGEHRGQTIGNGARTENLFLKRIARALKSYYKNVIKNGLQRNYAHQFNSFPKQVYSMHAMIYDCHSVHCSQPNCQAIKWQKSITDPLCSAMAFADQTEAKLAASLTVKEGLVPL